MATIANLMVKLGLNSAEFADGLRKAQGQLQSAGQKMAGVGKGLTAGVTLPIVGIGAAALTTAADFEQAMANVNAIANGTEDDLAKLTTAAEDLGRTTSFSASQAAEGMSFLAMAGFETNEVIAAMPGLLATAAAGNTDLATTADIVSNVLSGFNIAAGETGRVADVLTKTFTSSNTDLRQLGDAMKYVAPLSASLGVSIEDSATAIGFMSDAGIQASMAGTALRGILTRLAAPTKESTKVMRALGINVMDANGSLMSMPDILAEFQDKLGGMTDAQRSAALQVIVGTEAMSGFLAMMARGPEEFATFSQGLTDSAGTADQVASKQLDTFQGQMKLFQSAMEGLMITVGNAILPIVTSLAQDLTPLLARLTEWFDSMSPSTQKWILGIAAVVAAIGPLLVILGTLISSVGTIIGFISGAAGLIGSLGAAGAALTALATGPVGLTVAAVAGLALAYKTNFLGIRDATDAAVSWIGGRLNTLRGYWSKHSGEVSAIVSNQWENTRAMFEIQWELIRGISQAGMQFMTGDWEGGMETLRNMVGNIWERIRTIFQNQLDNIRNLFTFFGWPELGENIARGIGRGITDGLRWIRDAATRAAQSALDAAQSWLGINSPSTVAADEIGEPFGEGIGVGAGRAIDEITGMLGGRLDALMGGLQPTAGFAGDGIGGAGMTIQVTQNFYGQADAATVEGASRNGVVAALRQVGVR